MVKTPKIDILYQVHNSLILCHTLTSHKNHLKLYNLLFILKLHNLD